MRIGVISDTHGLLRPQAVAALEGVQHILHAGDIGDLEILRQLKAIAPVTAIRGNVDTQLAIRHIPETEAVELDGRLFYLVHNVKDLDLSPKFPAFAAIISGHSHKPAIERRHGVLFFNPGSAGPRRFSLPISIGFLDTAADDLAPQIRELQV